MVKNAFVEYKINAKCDLRKKEHEKPYYDCKI
jgi:hypothetical protein